jgi:uncharacterized protein YfbU (UPF0304 family)
MVKLSDGEKLILSMLCDIHKALKIDNSTADLVSSAIYSGNLWGLGWGLTGILHGSEPTDEQVKETVEIMDMWYFLEVWHRELSVDDKNIVEQSAAPLGKVVHFNGFDGNGEAEYISIADFLIQKLDRFQSFKGRDLNAHMPTLDAHRRMMAVYSPLRAANRGAALAALQIADILKEQIHPENRNRVGRMN